MISMHVLIVLGEKLPADSSTMSLILKHRLDKALELYGSKTAIMVCGGRVQKQNHHTEAYVMKRYLTRYLPDTAVIWKEAKSKTTVENAIYAYRMLRARVKRVSGITLITSEFHMRRASKIFDHYNTFGYTIKHSASMNGIKGVQLKRRRANEHKYLREFQEKTATSH